MPTCEMYYLFFRENSNTSFTTSNRWTGDGINCQMILNNTSLLAIVYPCDIKKITNRMIDQMNSLKFMHYPTKLFCTVWLVLKTGRSGGKLINIVSRMKFGVREAKWIPECEHWLHKVRYFLLFHFLSNADPDIPLMFFIT